MKRAFVFPGQGAQTVGMGLGLAEKYLEQANTILGFDLKKIVLEGPEEELKQTAVTQPAIFVISVAMFEQLTANGLRPDFVAGHSLGEYSALYAAGAISFADGVKILNRRGQFMQEAVPLGQGAMAALLGGDRPTIARICAEVGDVWPANFNSPGQVVISGKKEAVAAAGEKLKAVGVKKVIPLAVSAPFHCPLMQPAADKLAVELGKIAINDARVPVIANVDAQPVTKSEAIRQSLIKQVTGSVLWEDSVHNMVAAGVNSFVEVGPGKVLTGLIKKINPNIEAKPFLET